MRRLKDKARFPEKLPHDERFNRLFGLFAIFWVVSALAGLGLSIAAIYFLVKLAGAL
jgi:NADH:ubiquinone oxidoreductase subunit 4 (subunit M)